MFNAHFITTNTNFNLFNPQEHKNLLIDDVIDELAWNVTTENLIQIAMMYLGIHMDDIKNLEARYGNDTWEYRYHILTRWKNHNPNSGIKVSFQVYLWSGARMPIPLCSNSDTCKSESIWGQSKVLVHSNFGFKFTRTFDLFEDNLLSKLKLRFASREFLVTLLPKLKITPSMKFILQQRTFSSKMPSQHRITEL